MDPSDGLLALFESGVALDSHLGSADRVREPLDDVAPRGFEPDLEIEYPAKVES